MAPIVLLIVFVFGVCSGQRQNRPHDYYPSEQFRQNHFQNREYKSNDDERRSGDLFPPPTPSPQTSTEPHYRNDYVTPIPIIRLNKQQSIDGSYKTSYETGNNIVAEETGFIKNVGIKDEEALVQHGSYSYTAPDGTLITVTYTADEGGFRPVGDHLPTPPPVPEEVQKGLDIIFEQIRIQAEKEEREKQYENARQESENYPSDSLSRRNFRRR